MFWKCGAFEFDCRMPIVMGILNVTPDSFSGDGLLEEDSSALQEVLEGCLFRESAQLPAFQERALAQAHAMLEQGAAIIDVGGESTRPGATPATAVEELERVLEVVRVLAAEGVCVSIDTRHVQVASACIEAGASIINDVTGFADPEMAELACACDAGVVVMHCGGHFQGVRELACDDVVDAVREDLRTRCAVLEDAGVEHERICIDPGFGFGKSVRQCIELSYNFHELRHVGYPVMVALSRKRFVGEMYRIDDPAARDEASAEQALMACELGASVVRTHNVELTCKVLRDLRPYCIVGLGCNVPLVAEPGEEREAKIAQLNLAIGDLCMLPDTQLIDVSGFYESEPAYYEDQDVFVNAVALLRTGIAPKELLEYLHAIENALGRVREIPNGPRTLDLDIEDYQTYVVESDVLTLPHLRLTERDFVVKPLEDILPGHVLADGTPVASVPEADRIGKAFKI